MRITTITATMAVRPVCARARIEALGSNIPSSRLTQPRRTQAGFFVVRNLEL